MTSNSVHNGPRCRIGIDVGGTFTDFVLSNTATGQITYYKEPSVPKDPSLAVARGIVGLLERAGISTEAVGLIVHGTTIGLNSIIQRRGAKVALVVSPGNRDVLEIARCRMPSSFDFWSEKEEPLVPRDLVFEISARMAANGTILERPIDASLEVLSATLREKGVAAVAVMLLNSYADSKLEDDVVARLQARMPDTLVSGSCRIWPEIREYERALVATLNAYIHPLLDRYLSTLQERVAELGIRAPVYITASNGGSLSIDTARARPIDTVLSGPASGVVAATRTAVIAHTPSIITVDMGGTSSDFAVSQSGEPEYATRTDIGDFPLVLPVVSVSSIGAGGGSIVWVDSQGVLKVGPQSAGADPGPVCYRRGGHEPAVTDCYVAAGYIDPLAFLGGRMTLDKQAAVSALEGVAARVGISGPDCAAVAADAALQVATARMATELFKGMAQRGLDPRDFTLMSFGGAGPTHANLLAEEAGLARILVPPAPGTFCAMGAIMADVKRDYARTVRRRLDEAGAHHLVDVFSGLEMEALAWLKTEGDIVGATTLMRSADMRYAGQAYEINVAFPPEMAQRLEVAATSELFHREHEKIYGFRDSASAIEVITVRLRVVGRVPPVVLPKIEEDTSTPRFAGHRPMYRHGQWLDAAVYRRADLRAAHRISGPALVEQEDTTTLILPGWTTQVDAFGNLRITKD